MTTLSAAITLLLLMDPLGNAPVFLGVLRGLEARKRRLAIVRELLFALVVLLVFLFFGRWVLGALGITPPALTMAGGVVLFLVALRMIFPGQHGSLAGNADGDPWVVPLAIPLIAGPSSLAWVMLLSTQAPQRMDDWLTAVLIAWGVTAVVLSAAGLLAPFLKEKALQAIERLMGMVLIIVSIQMLMDGLARFLAVYGLAGKGMP